MVIRHSVHSGRGHGLAVALAHGLGVGLYALISVIGIAALIMARPSLLYGLQAGGALFLLWLAWGAFRSAMQTTPVTMETSQPSHTGALRDGFLIAFFNPKIAVFFIALFSQFVDVEQGMLVKSAMAAMAMLIDTLWYVVVAMVLSTATARAGYLSWRRVFEAAFAVLLTGVALRMLWLLAEHFLANLELL